MTDRRRALLVAALAALRVRNLDAPELRLVHFLLDSWRGIGLVVVGMARQGCQVSLGDHGPGQWIAVFYRGRGGHERTEAARTAQAPRLWEAMQRAAWEAAVTLTAPHAVAYPAGVWQHPWLRIERAIRAVLADRLTRGSTEAVDRALMARSRERDGIRRVRPTLARPRPSGGHLG